MTEEINIEDQDVNAAQSGMITQLINENLQLRAMINRLKRDRPNDSSASK